MNSINLDQAQQRRVEHYFAYEYKQKNNPNLIETELLAKCLPYRLRHQVVFEASRDLLTALFTDLGSDNLLLELAQVLDGTIFLPGDLICQRGELATGLLFVAEGEASALAADKQSIVEWLPAGDHYGELALYKEFRHVHFV